MQACMLLMAETILFLCHLKVCRALQEHNTASHRYTCGEWLWVLFMAHAQVHYCISRIDRHVDTQSFSLSSDHCCALSSHHTKRSASEEINALHGSSSTWGLWLLCKLFADSLRMRSNNSIASWLLCVLDYQATVWVVYLATKDLHPYCASFSSRSVSGCIAVCGVNQCECFTCTQAQRMNRAPCEREMCYSRRDA
jgi:hypothetical protein